MLIFTNRYVLERHLRREEVIYPKKPIGTFRGDSVYPRSSVVVCKSTETYMREGKRVKGGENPLKMVKPRTVTINRKRETELLKMDGQPVPLQGLFAEWQTELLIPPPIVDVSFSALHRRAVVVSLLICNHNTTSTRA